MVKMGLVMVSAVVREIAVVSTMLVGGDSGVFGDGTVLELENVVDLEVVFREFAYFGNKVLGCFDEVC